LQNGLDKKVEKSRKQKKERRNRARTIRGAKKNGREWVEMVQHANEGIMHASWG
jgi:hypothetical protein